MGTGKTTAPRRRKPHNVRKEQYQSFDELLATIGYETRVATIGDQEVMMTRLEAVLRVMIDRALQGNVRELTKILRIMANDPGLAATARSQIIITVGGALAGI